jgi:hypothetical protein
MILRGTSQSRTGMDKVMRGKSRPGAVILRRLLLTGVIGSLLTLTGCPYYAVPPGTVMTTPASFDRSFAAASGAMRDEGLCRILPAVRSPADLTVLP